MIVCICNNVNSNTIQTALEEGAATVDAVREQTGAAGCCGKCQFKVNRMVNDHHGCADAAMQDAACTA